MKIYNIQLNSNNKIQSFKQLRLKQGSEKYLPSMPKKILNKLDKVGEDIQNTKFYNLEIDKDGFYISHINGEKLYLPISVNDAGKVLLIKAKQCLTTKVLKLKYETDKEVEQAYTKIKGTTTLLERTAQIIKILDEYEQKNHIKTSEIVINTEDSVETKIEKLIKKYGI